MQIFLQIFQSTKQRETKAKDRVHLHGPRVFVSNTVCQYLEVK